MAKNRSGKIKRAWPLTSKNAQDFCESQGDLRLNGYLISTDEHVTLLTEILDKSTDFNELKDELTKFVSQRKKFVDWLDPKMDMNTGYYKFD